MKLIRSIVKVLLAPMLVLMAWRGNPENLVLDKMREVEW